MILSVQPLTARMRARAGLLPPFEATADAVEEWAPPATFVAPPVIQLPGEVDRVLGFAPGDVAAPFADEARGRVVHHPATVARRYRDATVFAGSLYGRRRYLPVFPAADRRSRLAWHGTPAAFGEAVLATNYVVERYFGHWLLDGLGLELLAAGRGVTALGFPRAQWPDEAEYRRRTGLALAAARFARVRDLWVVDDRAMNGSRVARMGELRRRVRGDLAEGPRGAPVFLRRSGGVRRALVNQEALADELARRGFTILTPEAEDPAAMRQALAGAPLVVSVEGSALSHAIVGMADGGTVLAIQPPRRATLIQKAACDCAGLRFAHVVADDRADDSFHLPAARLFDLLDRVARENPFQ